MWIISFRHSKKLIGNFRFFTVPSHSADGDVKKMIGHLLEEKVTCEREDRVNIKVSEPRHAKDSEWNYLKSSGSESATDDG